MFRFFTVLNIVVINGKFKHNINGKFKHNINGTVIQVNGCTVARSYYREFDGVLVQCTHIWIGFKFLMALVRYVHFLVDV